MITERIREYTRRVCAGEATLETLWHELTDAEHAVVERTRDEYTGVADIVPHAYPPPWPSALPFPRD